MEHLKRAAILAVIVLALGFAPKAQAAETFLGDFCWNATVTEGQEVLVIQIILGVFEKDNGHFALYGTTNFGGQAFGALNGNAEIVGGDVLLTLTETDVEDVSFVFGEIIQATLDAGTLGGTFHILEMELDLNSEQVQLGGFSGTMALTACPGPV